MKSLRILFYTICIAAMVTAILAARRGSAAVVDPAAAPVNVEVKINNFAFTPATLTVSAGTQVTWTNNDEIPHNVVSDDKAIKSKVLDTDEKFSFTFSKPGTYSYVCSIHPRMKGKIVVQ